ncbi:serine hydrolase domain-containing protein [Henriciella aquimarina]|uniref:serine hydrolase domain-containing protein n=1 Tax=Henriciella aquimarina TaxID=545261 RepID=UPI000A065D92|nr:serine hydrolase domain-containing protein [Henriciella aquimarina]
MSDIRGFVAPGFEPVRDVFEATFEAGEELGAGFSAILDGEVIVDLQGGFADRGKETAWDERTLVPIYSTTKGIAALVIARIIDTLDEGYETKVSAVWPEFASAGKADVTIGEMLSHQAGLVGFAEPIDPALWLDPPALSAALADLEPLWEPGTAHGYHPLTWGYLAGELVQRIAGRSLGTILREDICEPLDIDFHIGLPEEEHDRVAGLMRPREMPQLGELNEFKKIAFLTKWAAPDRGGAQWREIEIPSANGHGTAQSVARLYGAYANGGRIDGKQLVPEDSFAALTRRQVIGEDLVLPFVTEFAAGVMRNNLGIYGPNEETLAHSGWGGSLALGDPARHLSAAYVMNRQSSFLQGDPRARRLVDALYGCL